ncbi:MAG: FG-GAP repeat protein [Planctomycetota bacterium]
MTGLVQAGPVEYAALDAGTVYLSPIVDQDWGRPLLGGDLDGDGYDEVIVAASESWGGVVSRVYVVRGGPGRHGLGIVDLSMGGVDQVIVGAEVNDNLGSSMAVGDVNGDEIDDLLICASGADFSGLVDRGVAYMIYGGADFFDLPTRELSIDTNWDLRIIGPVEYGDMGGSSLFGGLDAHGAAIGRINADGYGDIILGVHLADGGATQSGRVYVIFGGPFPSGFTLNLVSAGSYSIRINGDGTYDELGTVVLTGDLTGDGIEELIIPSHYASQGLFTSEGAVHIFRGRSTWNTTYNLASSPADLTLLGAREDDELGSAAAVGDFNADGITDLAVAAPGADAGAFNDQRGDGFVYGLLGSSVYQTGTHTLDYAYATPDFLMIGDFEENLGDEVSSGDFNGDGFDDIAAAERFGGPATNGVVEVLFGREFVFGETFTANIDTDIRIVGAAQDRIGFSLSASDVNGDGLDEVLFGTPFNNGYNGTVYVFTHVSGDADYDHDVDLADFARMQGCAAGPLEEACVLFDFDLDEDVDALDLAEIGALLVGPGE